MVSEVMTRRSLLLCALFLPGSTVAKPEEAEWAGHTLQEVKNLRELPAGVQAALGVGKPALDGIADRGERYNATDVADSRLPMRRFLVGGFDDRTALIAVEHGGIGWGVIVYAFSYTAQRAAIDRKWNMSKKPESLRDLIAMLRSREATAR